MINNFVGAACIHPDLLSQQPWHRCCERQSMAFDLIFLTSAYENDWLTLSLSASSSYRPSRHHAKCLASPDMVITYYRLIDARSLTAHCLHRGCSDEMRSAAEAAVSVFGLSIRRT